MDAKPTVLTYAFSIYPKALVELAIQDYSAYGAICVLSASEDRYEVAFRDCRYGDAETVNEFNNYLIELLNERAAHADH